MNSEDSARVSSSEILPRARAVGYGRSINVLCICGAIIGVAAVFCEWTYFSQVDYFVTGNLIDYIVPDRYHDPLDLSLIGGLIFVLGTGLAFVTPLSGLVQASGMVAFAIEIRNRASDVSSYSDGTMEFGLWIGFYVGIASAAIVLLSIPVPMGPGIERHRYDIRNRLFVFNGWRIGRKAHHIKRPKLVAKAIIIHRKWVSILIAVMLASTILVLHDRDFFREDPLLAEVMGGVILEPCSPDLGLYAAGPWESYHISMYEGENGTGWAFQNAGLDDGTWSALPLGEKAIGDLNVSLVIIDKWGDGMVGFGDSLVFTAQDDKMFVDDVVYRLLWSTNRTIAWSGWEISFMFHDGNLDSRMSLRIIYGL